MVMRLCLPYRALVIKALDDLVSRYALDRSNNLGDAEEVASCVSEGTIKQMNVICHHNRAEELKLPSVLVQAMSKDDLACLDRQIPASVAGKCHQDYASLTLKVWESAAVERLRKSRQRQSSWIVGLLLRFRCVHGLLLMNQFPVEPGQYKLQTCRA